MLNLKAITLPLLCKYHCTFVWYDHMNVYFTRRTGHAAGGEMQCISGSCIMYHDEAMLASDRSQHDAMDSSDLRKWERIQVQVEV